MRKVYIDVEILTIAKHGLATKNCVARSIPSLVDTMDVALRFPYGQKDFKRWSQ